MPCVNCSAGAYRDDRDPLGNASCAACPANSGATCVACTTRSECLCNAGYTVEVYQYESQEVCNACIAGKYKSDDTNAGCMSCANGTYSSAQAGATSCVACPPGSGQNCGTDFIDPATGEGCWNASHCLCNDMHYGQDGGLCSGCPAGTGGKCIASNSFRCKDISDCACGDGTYAAAGEPCTACPSDATAVCWEGTCTGLNDCYDGCPRGQFGLGWWFSGCDICPPDSGETCYGVPGETCASAAECICNAGSSGPAGGPCA